MFSSTGEGRTISRYWWFAAFLLAVLLWSIGIERPVDLPAWHELDYSSIARNFVREGNNIFYPRIDWRGSGPGFTEMEFPIVPWIMAQVFRVFGIHEIVGRLLSLACMLSSLFVFRKLALKLLPEPAAFAATLFFLVSHEIVMVATAIQPESLMFLCYLLAAYCFLDWYESQSWFSYGFAAFSFACAILVKSPAAHLAILFFLWALMQDGLKAFRKPSLYLFAVLSFAPALLWYSHAASLWHQFHNSMGVSNEDHWFGMDMLRRPKVFLNLFMMDLVFVFGIGGVLTAAASVIKDRLASPVNRFALSWCLAVAIYLIVILRTSAGYWAAYYHVVAVPPIALLFGAGLYQVAAWRRIAPWLAVPAILITAFFLWLNHRDLSRMPGVLQDLAVAHSTVAVLLVLIVIAFSVTVLLASLLPKKSSSNSSLTYSLAIAAGCFTYFLVSGQLLLGTWKTDHDRTPLYQTAASFQDKIPTTSLIVASGGICSDSSGHRVANDAPNMFYWLDLKGFTTCEGHESAADLQSYIKQGARYFIVNKSSFAEQPDLESNLRHSYPVVADGPAAMIFKLAD